MEYSSPEPRISALLHARACAEGIPLAGTFEITPRCNLNCKMCYVRLSAQEQQARGRELTADEWLAIAEQARSGGMLFLLLTGGEPLIRPDFRYMLTELKRMGLLVSVNSNATLIDEDWLRFFKSEPPFRFNITLYGGSGETYERLCGSPVYDRAAGSIRALHDIGIDVKLNATMTQYNVQDMRAIYDFAGELGVPLQLSTYMFPPVRRDERLVGGGERFGAEEAARYAVEWDRMRLTPEQFALRARQICAGSFPEELDACAGAPGEGIGCRAGRSTFWINWLGDMTPCGMMSFPAVSVPELGFVQAWARTMEATAQIRLPAACSSCGQRELCHLCAAMSVTETGEFDKRPDYLCRMTHEMVRLMEESARL